MTTLIPANRPDAWKLAERRSSQKNMKEVGEQMLWALLHSVPVAMRDPLDHNILPFEHITEVRYQIPSDYNQSSVVVTMEDPRHNTMRTKGEYITIENAPSELAVWDKLDMDEPRRSELFTAMRKAHTVICNGREYARITAILFHKDEHHPDRLAVSIEAIDHTDGTTKITAPQAAFTVTGHLLNRE